MEAGPVVRQEGAEAKLRRVMLDQSAYGEWSLSHRDAATLRKAERLLAVDAACLREQLERERFLTRRSATLGAERCMDCGGTGDGEMPDGGTCLVPTSCDTCAGAG